MQPTDLQHLAIAQSYERAEWLYRLAWQLGKAKQMNYGLWYPHTPSLSEALGNLNRLLAQTAEIKPEDHVLDVGCGVGGSSLFLGQQIGCHVTGINLSARQINLARRYAQHENLAHLLHFEVADYHAAPFPDHSFDVVWVVESLFHSHQKLLFFREMSRLLKPDGRLVMAEYVSLKPPTSQMEADWLHTWHTGYQSAPLPSPAEYGQLIQQAGFTAPHLSDLTAHIGPSAQRLYRWGKMGERVGRLTNRMGKLGKWLNPWDTHTKATIAQYLALEKGLWGYYLITAQKLF